MTLDEIREELREYPPHLTLKQASQATGISTRSLRRRVNDGSLAAMRSRADSGGGLLLIPRAILAEFMYTLQGETEEGRP
jgi:hypothetical protein